MNVILFDDTEISGDQRIILKDQRFRHIRDTHRATIGDSVRVGQINGLMGTAIINNINQYSIELTAEFTTPPPEKLPLTVVLALPRPKMIRRIFRTIAEMGVNELVIINSYKVEKSFWQSPAITEANIHSYLIDGLQQAKDTVLPKVSFHRLFKPFVEDTLPALSANTRKIIAHPATGITCPHQANQAITLAVGPEGGFTDYEAQKLISLGFEAINLGPRILKVENAVTTLIAKLYS